MVGFGLLLLGWGLVICSFYKVTTVSFFRVFTGWSSSTSSLSDVVGSFSAISISSNDSGEAVVLDSDDELVDYCILFNNHLP